jgi:hypothetical protein
MSETILSIGASGKFAGMVIPELARTFELCAEGWLDRHEVATMISEVLGRKVMPARLDPDSLGDEARALRPMFDHYDRIGLRGSALTLRAILGRSPRTLHAYFEELTA